MRAIAAWVLVFLLPVMWAQSPAAAKGGFPVNAGPDGRPSIKPSNLNPLMGAKSRRTGSYTPPAAQDLVKPRAPTARELLDRSSIPKADQPNQSQPSHFVAPGAASAPRASKPQPPPNPARRSRFAAPLRHGAAAPPVGAARRVLSTSSFAPDNSMPGGAKVHSQFTQPGPFAGTKSKFRASTGAAPLKRPGGKPAHLRHHGQPAAQEDDRERTTIGTINHIDNTFSAEYPQKGGVARDVHGNAYSSEHMSRAAKPKEDKKPVNQAIVMEGASHYEPAMGEM